MTDTGKINKSAPQQELGRIRQNLVLDGGSSSGSGSEGEGDASPTRGSIGAFFDRGKVVATSRRLNAAQNKFTKQRVEATGEVEA
eukprot:5971675-Alexandrium_andersonii.AAC.1